VCQLPNDERLNGTVGLRLSVPPQKLTPSAPQRGFQSLLLVIPAGLFGLRSFLKSLNLGLDGGSSLRVFLLGLVQRSLRLVDRLLTAFTLLLPSGLFLRPFKFAARLLPLIGESGLSLRSLIDGREEGFFVFGPFDLRAAFVDPPPPRLVGSSACSLKGRSVPTGRLRTTPGFARVAAITSGSWLSFAAPWWKRLLSAPHASKAAFMDGAAIA
jgi:hypothetical protein